jgi:hypothetical protein
MSSPIGESIGPERRQCRPGKKTISDRRLKALVAYLASLKYPGRMAGGTVNGANGSSTRIRRR